MDTLSNENASPANRLAAARDLMGFQAKSDDAIESVLDAITPQTAPDFAGDLLDVVRLSESEGAGGVLLEYMADLSPSIKSSAINVLLSKSAWTNSLLDAVEKKEFDLDELSLEQKQNLRSLPTPSLKKGAERLLAMGGGLPDADREKVLQSLMHVTKKTGDVDAGRAVFKKVCAACHQHGKMGVKIGPQPDGNGGSPQGRIADAHNRPVQKCRRQL